MKIVFTGGGTAGHIFPILAIIREIKELNPAQNMQFFYIGPKDSYVVNLLIEEGVRVKNIITGKLRRYFSFKNIFDLLFKAPIGFFQALGWLFLSAPDMIFSKGGYGSFPAVFASRILQIPIFLHESDASPGIASKIQSRWALDVFTSFAKTEHFKKEKIICVGNPVRRSILGGSKEEAKKIFYLQEGRPLIFIVGGSQGAVSINNIILEILPEFLSQFELVHQTGRKNYEQVKAEANVLVRADLKKYYHIIPFLNEAEMKHILAAADLIISRAGAGAIFEIAAVGKPGLLIPMPASAQAHQIKNAYQFAQSGAGEVLEQANLTPHFFFEKIKYLFSRPDVLEQYAESAKSFARPKTAKIIANYLLEYLVQASSPEQIKND